MGARREVPGERRWDVLRYATGWRGFVGIVVAVAFAAGCGGSSGSSDTSGTGGTPSGSSDASLIVGTTDTAVHFDPANAYDLHSWNVIYSVYDMLMVIPAGGNEPQPSLAESCAWDDPKTYNCTLRTGVTFSNGDPLTSKDVAFSFERSIKINGDQGVCFLLASLAECGTWTGKEITTPDDSTVIFHLSAPDATWPFVLATGAGAIVPSGVYPADALQPDDQVIGSGAYTLAKYQPGVQTVLERNADYWGDAPKNARVLIQYYKDSPALKLAIQGGDIDIAFRNLTATDIEALRGESGINVVEGNGTEIRYLVFNTKLEPGNNKAVRRAVAYTVDRQSIVDNVYNGTVQPLYSMIPQGLVGATEAYKDEYGDAPDVEAAKKELSDAGVQTPVSIELWWTPSHYGDGSADEYTEIKRQLEESGLFKVTLKSEEWEQYTEDKAKDVFPAFQLGWFPDFPDADNYSSPFYPKGGFWNGHYDNPAINTAIAEEKAATDVAAREAAFATIQELAAKDAPTVPVWQGKQIAVVKDGVTGVEETFDVAYIFRYWLISKG
ncbi:MAG: peptide/nickel transport system substrate-binding protein [Gaiellales bacterium]|nr:peptide/nickel transport system substrate-binding protein [Gaiellales bacterium]